MSEGYVKVDASNLKEMLTRFERVIQKSMPDLVRANARIACIELGNRTQPFTVGSGTGPPVLERGTKYLRKDLLKIAKDRAALDEKVSQIDDVNLRARLQSAVASGNQSAIGALLFAVKSIKHPSDFRPVSGPSEMAEIHKTRRSRRTGHAMSTRPVYHYAPNGIDGYVNTIAKRIGYAKSGWAECARKIGGVSGDGARGIPAFAKRHKASNADVDLTKLKSISNPYVTMTNTTYWVSRLLPEQKQKDALNIAKEKMIEQMSRIISYVAKNGKDVESKTSEIIDQSAA